MMFAEYMDKWLYEKDGYYSQFKEIGKKGDFYTSVSVSPLFGGAIAKQIISIIDEGFLANTACITEIGAHKGYLLADIIQFIYTIRPKLLETLEFAIIERFAHLQTIQKQYFKDSFGDAIKLSFYNDIKEFKANNAFFIANEIFDAFPCQLLHKEKFASVKDHNIKFDIEDNTLLKKAKKYHKVRGEIAVGYEEFAKNMANSTKKFEFVTFDYGDLEARPDFSIRIYKDHEVFALFDENINIKDFYANNDITYDVNFSHLRDAFEENNIKMQSFKTQLVALVDFGIMDLVEELKQKVDQKIYARELEKVKRLISPSFMGERFKMINFRKEC